MNDYDSGESFLAPHNKSRLMGLSSKLYGSSRKNYSIPAEVISGNWSEECVGVLSSSRDPSNKNKGMNILKKSNSKRRTSKSSRSITWCDSVLNDTRSTQLMMMKESPIPRRLSLQQKIELYADRPDLDLGGILQRLEALKRLESMSRIMQFRSSTQEELTNVETKAADDDVEMKEDDEDSMDERYEEEGETKTDAFNVSKNKPNECSSPGSPKSPGIHFSKSPQYLQYMEARKNSIGSNSITF